jgi:hypothetical protein
LRVIAACTTHQVGQNQWGDGAENARAYPIEKVHANQPGVAQGALATMQGIGASTSGLVTGLIVDNFGYSPAFIEAAAVATAALLTLALLMPELDARAFTRASLSFLLPEEGFS